MKLYIIAVGKVKSETYLKEINNYLKQLPYNLKIIEVKDEPTKEGMKKEKAAILKKLPKNSYLIALDKDGKDYNSLEFSEHLKDLTTTQNKDLVFIIGGSYGLDEEILSLVAEKLSFSKFTFPHQLMRVLLVEQIYRAFKIMDNHPYHK